MIPLEDFKQAVWKELDKGNYKSVVSIIIAERGFSETLEDYNIITDGLIEEAFDRGLDNIERVAIVVTLGLQTAYADYCKIVGFNPVRH